MCKAAQQIKNINDLKSTILTVYRIFKCDKNLLTNVTMISACKILKQSNFKEMAGVL